MNLANILIRPVLTEKTVSRTDAGKYTFEVSQDSTKIDVKNAFLALYGVAVVDVNIVKGLPKTRLGKNRKPMQKRAATRRAIITLKKGEVLDLTKLKTSK